MGKKKPNEYKQQAATATAREKETYDLSKALMARNTAKAAELDGNRRQRLGGLYDLRDRSNSFLKNDEQGKDVTGLIAGDLNHMQNASDSAKQSSRMAAKLGGRAFGGAADANLTAQLDTMKDLEGQRDYARDAAQIYGTAKENAKSDMANSTSAINTDEFNTASLLSNNASQGFNQWQGANQANENVIGRKPQGWFSKYGMPFIQAAVGVTSSYMGRPRK